MQSLSLIYISYDTMINNLLFLSKPNYFPVKLKIFSQCYCLWLVRPLVKLHLIKTKVGLVKNYPIHWR